MFEINYAPTNSARRGTRRTTVFTSRQKCTSRSMLFSLQSSPESLRSFLTDLLFIGIGNRTIRREFHEVYCTVCVCVCVWEREIESWKICKRFISLRREIWPEERRYWQDIAVAGSYRKLIQIHPALARKFISSSWTMNFIFHGNDQESSVTFPPR